MYAGQKRDQVVCNRAHSIRNDLDADGRVSQVRGREIVGHPWRLCCCVCVCCKDETLYIYVLYNTTLLIVRQNRERHSLL